MYDVAIIGAGVIGSFIARELARYDLQIVLLEKEADVANGITKANSAIIHSGYSVKPGTLKARLNAVSNPMFDALCTELDVPFKRIGSLLVALQSEDMEKLMEKYQQGIANGVTGLQILDAEQTLVMEPNINPAAIAALYAPTTGIVGPWELNMALAENAVDNGVELRLNTQVQAIQKIAEGFVLSTSALDGNITAKYVFNCAGLYADEINNMIAAPSFRIVPKRGNYFVLDKSEGEVFHHVIFMAHKKGVQSVIVTPTVHGNMLIGPTAEEVQDKSNLKTTREQLERVKKASELTSRAIRFDKAITCFAGLRPKPEVLVRDLETGETVFSDEGQDFIISALDDVPGFINVVGIKSPGLSSSPAIAAYAINFLKKIIGEPVPKPGYNPCRRKAIRFSDMSDIQRVEMIQQDPSYGKIICRCEQISEAEIVDAIHRNVGAKTVDGVKKRTRSGMGRCQGGFCGPKVLEILARELHIDTTEVEKNQRRSYISVGKVRE